MKSEQVDLDQFRKGSLTKVAKKPDQWSNHTIYVSGHIFSFMVVSANLAEGTLVQLGPQEHPIFFYSNICDLYLLYVGTYFWWTFVIVIHQNQTVLRTTNLKLYNLLWKDLKYKLLPHFLFLSAQIFTSIFLSALS